MSDQEKFFYIGSLEEIINANNLNKKEVKVIDQLDINENFNSIFVKYINDQSSEELNNLYKSLGKKNIIIGKADLDITKDILGLLDKKITKVTLD